MLYLRKTPSRLALKLFRGEPAISGFDWNFSPTHTSSPPNASEYLRKTGREEIASLAQMNAAELRADDEVLASWLRSCKVACHIETDV